MNNSINHRTAWKSKIKELSVNAIIGCIALSFISSGAIFILYKITRIYILKQIAALAMLPLFAAFTLFLLFFFGSFVIYCFLCLIPWRKEEPQIFIFGEDGSLPWWGALMWLVVMGAFISQVVPNIIEHLTQVFAFLNDLLYEINKRF